MVELIHNAALLTLTAIGLYLVKNAPNLDQQLSGKVFLGLSFGLVTFLVTAAPMMLPNGSTVDARAGPVIVAGMIGGPISAVIAGGLGALARVAVGGAFAFSGAIVFVLYALIGSVLWEKCIRGGLGAGLSVRRQALACVLSIAAAGLMFFFITPRSVAQAWLTQNLPTIALANVVSILFCGVIARIVLDLASQRAKLSKALDTLELAKAAGGVGIWNYDVTENRAVWDDDNLRLHGLAPASGDAVDWERCVHPDDLHRVKSEFADALSGSRPFDTQYRIVLPNNSVRYVKSIAIVLRDKKNRPVRVVGAGYDVTEPMEKEQELQKTRSIAAQAQRLQTIGTLTGGVAHDFNNLLAIIQGNLEFLQADLQKLNLLVKDRADILESAISAAARGGELTRNMLAFARQSPLEPKHTRINDLVRETEIWVRRAIPSSITIETDLAAYPGPLRLDQASLQSAIVNIIVNARDAMPDGGCLRISTATRWLSDQEIANGELEVLPGQFVVLSIADTGVGIPADLLPRVFEPFVSGKDRTLGSGLGLSMVQGFVHQSGGFLEINSAVGQGTTIMLCFPVVPGQADDSRVRPTDRNAAQHEDVSLSARRNARLLIVEDQKDVLAMLARTLKAEGYRVEGAVSGDAAIGAFKTQGPFDLLLTDVVLPGDLNGFTLAEACRDISPALPVVFLSGYPDDEGRDEEARPQDARLMKPVTRAELLKEIARALQKTAVTAS
ncbi:MAG: ATP-binding protein [Pseudomonadota bacterium]